MPKHFMLRKIPAHHPFAYFFLAFITMAGLSYINFLPGVVNALAGGIGFSDVEAGQIVAVNGYGGLIGSGLAVFLVRRIHWQPAIYTFLLMLAVIDIGTVWVKDYNTMLGWRFFAGILGGLSVGFGFSVLARLNNPDRAFGILLFIQFTIGSLVIYLLPALEAQLGAHAVFYAMASFVSLSLVMMLFLPSLSLDNNSTGQAMSLSGSSGKALLLLFAIISYLIGASAIWAYVGLIGLDADMTSENVSTYIALTGLLGLPGAMLPVLGGARFGRLYWIMTGIALSALAALLLNFSQHSPVYITAMALLFFSWPAVQSYLLAATAEIDSSGRLSTIAAVVSSVGLATGPLLASGLLDNGNFSVMLYSCAIIFLLSFLLLLKPVQAQEKARTQVLSS
ncbi:MFS transporter [Thalassomonas actiniarum]|uniref:MFS transporter n=1 Tax=Thalassomonas actiniarum TaxID=485447 RepID=A0AAE9YR90_9GAMM|nr:MFS transporter [Thalassomonas actiniarum]WDD99615.1 MFS transporter [Thalassomonas actiniarum]